MTGTPSGFGKYLAILMAFALLSGLLSRIVTWGYANLGCPVRNDPGIYLAYCTSAQYGDYEHGAYFLGLEPAAVENLKRADVLMLGNSRPQFGFSTEAVRQFFAEHNIRYHLMGFGYAEGITFEAELMKRLGLRPKFLLIDVSPFFRTFLAEPGRALVEASPRGYPQFLHTALVWLEYAAKRSFNRIHTPLCSYFSHLCQSRFKAIYRRTADGAWLTETYLTEEAGGRPLHDRIGVRLDDTPPEPDMANARDFFQNIGLPPECVVLTVVPTSAIEADAYAREIGRRLGLRVVLPRIDGLTTLDDSHLTAASAERWSAEMMRLNADAIKGCVR